MKSLLAILIFLMSVLHSVAQEGNRTDSTITSYFHIRNPWGDRWNRDSIVGFELKNIDTLGNINWYSKQVSEFEKDEDGYFVKANIPMHVLKNSSQVWCTSIALESFGNSFDTIRYQYGGVRLSKIKLNLRSSPEGAETYLIPNRIWMNNFENINLSNDASKIQKFRVNTSATNTYAFIDETVFVIIYKINNQYKQLVHHTKPFNIEPEQTVWINF